MRNQSSEDEGRCEDTGRSSDELSGYVEESVASFDFSQAQEGDRESRIHLRAGALAPGRVNDANGAKTHREPTANTPKEVVCDENRRTWIAEKCCEEVGGNHEAAKTGGFDEVFGPVLAQSGNHCGCNSANV